ncbi:MAG: phosphoglycerate dehydrogenase [Myxococcales bacterium]|nr:phosphoglycerate dehydrogenase [Myxococcota bacterium]MDW8283192.1 phosphoglycerate dehydrogenase [Myxococcales bacterium]
MPAIHVLVADPLAEEGLARLRARGGVTVSVRPGLSEEALAEAVRGADGLIIRSGVRVTARVLERPGRLRAVVRAGVGVDNVDLEAATQRGILVMNTPDGNTITTAEHTLALMLALSRHVPTADALVRAGRFAEARKTCMGAQLAGKVLGIVGLGRVGRAVAQRALGLEMKVLGYDPYYSGEAVDLPSGERVPLLPSLDELLPQVDYLTLHTPLSEGTRHMIGRAQLQRMKRTARLLNVARGGLVHEAELAAALAEGLIAGAAVDVFEQEPPPPDHPLLRANNVVLTSHLGASTEEAQSAVAVEAADLLLDYLLADRIRNAVNAPDLKASLSDHDRRHLDLARRLGRLAAVLSSGRLRSVRLVAAGQGLEPLASTLARAALVELLRPGLDTPPNLINAPLFAQARGLTLSHEWRPAGEQGGERLMLIVEQEGGPEGESGGSLCCEGAVYHQVDNRPRLLSVAGYRMDLVPEGPLLLLFNRDEPGVVGLVGTLLGRHRVNIADMTLSRQGSRAMMLLKLDAEVQEGVLEQLRALPPVERVYQVSLPPLAPT